MNITPRMLLSLLTRTKVLHIGFCGTVLVFFFIGALSNARGLEAVAPRLVATYLFCIGCIYAGRQLYRSWLIHQQMRRFLEQSVLFSLNLCGLFTAGRWLFFTPNTMSLLTNLLLSIPIVGLLEGIGIFLSMIRTQFRQQVQQARLAELQRTSELHLLQAQLSPHFLFNTLNNLYGLSIAQSERVPPLLLELSDLLRYSLYATKHQLVPLKNEVAYLRTYSQFESIRIGELLRLTLDLAQLDDESLQIAPMLLIVFVENAFKHARNTFEQHMEIQMRLWVDGARLVFFLRNTFDKAGRQTPRPYESMGLGLANTRKRLDLLYGNAYQFKQTQENGFYTVELELTLNEV